MGKERGKVWTWSVAATAAMGESHALLARCISACGRMHACVVPATLHQNGLSVTPCSVLSCVHLPTVLHMLSLPLFFFFFASGRSTLNMLEYSKYQMAALPNNVTAANNGLLCEMVIVPAISQGHCCKLLTQMQGEVAWQEERQIL